MGLILKLKRSQQKNWDVFLNHTFDIFNQSKLIGIPFGKSGYGFITNLFDPIILDFIINEFGSNLNNRVIFLSNNLENCKYIAECSDIFIENYSKILPNDIVFRVNPLTKVNFGDFKDSKISDPIWDLFAKTKINIMVPKHPVIQAFLQKMESNHQIPLIIGFLVGETANDRCLEAENLLDFYGDDVLGVILGSGRVQKGKRIKSPTIIEISNTDRAIIEHEGIVSSKKLIEVDENIKFKKMDD